MPLYATHYTAAEGGWATWKMTETPDELFRLLPPGGLYATEIARSRLHPKRLLERLAVRALMYRCWHEEHAVAYRSDGKPCLTDHKFHISITHTAGYAGLCWSICPDVSVDMESRGPKALRLAFRFMHPDEYADGPSELAALLHWSAKETLYKMLPEQEGTDFARDLFIRPFAIENEGIMTGTDRRKASVCHSIAYRLFPDFVLTWHHPVLMFPR